MNNTFGQNREHACNTRRKNENAHAAVSLATLEAIGCGCGCAMRKAGAARGVKVRGAVLKSGTAAGGDNGHSHAHAHRDVRGHAHAQGTTGSSGCTAACASTCASACVDGAEAGGGCEQGCEPGTCGVAESSSEEGEDAEEAAGWLGVARKTWMEGGVGLALYAAALLLPVTGWGRMALFAAAWFAFGREVLVGAVRGIFAGRWFDEFFLMTVASLGAFLIGEFPEAVAVMLFYRIGEAMQDAAVDRSKGSIRALMAIRPDKAMLLGEQDEIMEVTPESVEVGHRFLVRPGTRVPVDGMVEKGQADLDLSALTGESVPVAAGPGMEVLSGSISTNGSLVLRALRPYADSAVGRILSLVETASSRKAKAERFVTRFSKVYTPAVTGAAVLLAILPPLLVPGQTFQTWLYRALVFLVVSCPCALVVSIPLGFFGGIGGAARRGILVKGGQYLEALNRVDTVVFDKTGTLTEGRFRVKSIRAAGSTEALNLASSNSTPYASEHAASGAMPEALKPAAMPEALKKAAMPEAMKPAAMPDSLKKVASVSVSIGMHQEEREVLRAAAMAEGHSTHPLAISILKAWEFAAAGEIPLDKPERVREHAGSGVEVWAEGRHVVCGKAALLKASGIAVPEPVMEGGGPEARMPHLSVHVAADGRYLGEITLEDTPREGAREAIDALRSAGIRNIAMLTGDAEKVAGHVARTLGVDEVHAGLLPHQKVERLETMMKRGRKAVFVGDGINDAPVLVRADVGIAMGGIGSDAAMEAADIVLMRDDPALVAEAIRIARKTRRIVTQNIVLALGVKALVLILGAGGIATLWEAVFADVGVALLAVLNATRVLKNGRTGR